MRGLRERLQKACQVESESVDFQLPDRSLMTAMMHCANSCRSVFSTLHICRVEDRTLNPEVGLGILEWRPAPATSCADRKLLWRPPKRWAEG